MPNSVRTSKKGTKPKGSKSKGATKADKGSAQNSPVSVADPIIEEPEVEPVDFEPPALDSLDLLARDVANMLPPETTEQQDSSTSAGEKPAWIQAISPQFEVRHSCFTTVIARPVTGSAASASAAKGPPPLTKPLKFGRWAHCDNCSFYHYPHCTVCPRCSA
jgi:hypothetical protein